MPPEAKQSLNQNQKNQVRIDQNSCCTVIFWCVPWIIAFSIIYGETDPTQCSNALLSSSRKVIIFNSVLGLVSIIIFGLSIRFSKTDQCTRENFERLTLLVHLASLGVAIWIFVLVCESYEKQQCQPEMLDLALAYIISNAILLGMLALGIIVCFLTFLFLTLFLGFKDTIKWMIRVYQKVMFKRYHHLQHRSHEVVKLDLVVLDIPNAPHSPELYDPAKEVELSAAKL